MHLLYQLNLHVTLAKKKKKVNDGLENLFCYGISLGYLQPLNRNDYALSFRICIIMVDYC